MASNQSTPSPYRFDGIGEGKLLVVVGVDSHLLTVFGRHFRIHVREARDLLRVHGAVAVHNVEHIRRRLPQNLQGGPQFSL